MVMGTLRFAYSKAERPEKISLSPHAGGVWLTILSRYNFPSPSVTLRQMNEFYSARRNAFSRIESERMKAVNKDHWWELGTCFEPEYFERRDQVNKYQHLLGFPPIDIVKGYMHEHEYFPATLADCYADYMDAIDHLERRSYPAGSVQFDTPVNIELDDVILRLRVDVIFKREKIFKVKSELSPGTVASSFIYLNHFGNFVRINKLIGATGDIRYPMIGVKYTKDNGEAITFDGHETIILSPCFRNGAWNEDQTPLLPELKKTMLEKLNTYAAMFNSMERLDMGLPKLAPYDAACASCSYLQNCFTPGQSPHDNYSEKKREAEESALNVFQNEFDADADICDDRIKAMDLLAKILDFLKSNHDVETIDSFYRIAMNKKDDFLSERSRHAASKAKI